MITGANRLAALGANCKGSLLSEQSSTLGFRRRAGLPKEASGASGKDTGHPQALPELYHACSPYVRTYVRTHRVNRLRCDSDKRPSEILYLPHVVIDAGFS